VENFYCSDKYLRRRRRGVVVVVVVVVCSPARQPRRQQQQQHRQRRRRRPIRLELGHGSINCTCKFTREYPLRDTRRRDRGTCRRRFRACTVDARARAFAARPTPSRDTTESRTPRRSFSAVIFYRRHRKLFSYAHAERERTTAFVAREYNILHYASVPIGIL
jgi:hypothetical protein